MNPAASRVNSLQVKKHHVNHIINPAPFTFPEQRQSARPGSPRGGLLHEGMPVLPALGLPLPAGALPQGGIALEVDQQDQEPAEDRAHVGHYLTPKRAYSAGVIEQGEREQMEFLLWCFMIASLVCVCIMFLTIGLSVLVFPIAAIYGLVSGFRDVKAHHCKPHPRSGGRLIKITLMHPKPKRLVSWRLLSTQGHPKGRIGRPRGVLMPRPC